MTGRELLESLEIKSPDVHFDGPRPYGSFLGGMAASLASAARDALEGRGTDRLIDNLQRCAPWSPLASGVRVAAEVASYCQPKTKPQTHQPVLTDLDRLLQGGGPE